jgi:transglutaminase-like putative cysteine protease
MYLLQRLTLPGWATIWRRIRNTRRTVFTRGDFSTLIITSLIMVIPALSLTSLDITKDIARPQTLTWPSCLNQLIPVAILSVVFGFLLSRSHYSELLSLLLSGVYGVATIGVIQYVNAPGNPAVRLYAVADRFANSLNLTLGGSLDPFLLILFLSILVWFLGHNTAWHTFRLDRVWRAILPPGIVLVLNGFYNPDRFNMSLYLGIYVFLSMLLVIRSHIEAREFDWYTHRIAFHRSLRNWFYFWGAIAGVVLLALALLLPTGSAEDNQKRYEQFLRGDIINQLNQLINKLFGALEGQGVATADYYGSDMLTLGGAIQLGDQIVMIVKAPQGPRYYWESRVFDTYSDGKWLSTRHDTPLRDEQPGLVLRYPPLDPSVRRDVSQQFTMVLGASRLVYAAPQPVMVDLPVEVEMDTIDPLTRTINPSVIHPLTPLQAGDEYSVLSSISVASAPYLRNTPTDIPTWVRALDLQLPPNVTQRTKALAEQIVQGAGAQTNYDKAKAIEQWLRKNIQYNEAIPNPPRDVDLVDWVLFTEKRAYCTYYASSMIVMLRMLGIPARMGAGFAQGIWDPTTQSFIVRERDAHTWVEVYFPLAGWVEFEPTSAQQTLDRPDSNGPPPTATPSPSPTPSPTPTPPPTATRSGPQAAGISAQTQQPQMTFTSTPPPTSTLTPTPVLPPPPSFLDLPPPVRNVFRLLLIAAVMIAILSFLLVGFLWWVEYRGLDRLSQVGRAYARLAVYARWLGIPLSESSTPLERSRRIGRDVPDGSRPVTSITDMYVEERYARPKDVTPDEEKEAQAAWRTARRAFIARKIRKLRRRG